MNELIHWTDKQLINYQRKICDEMLEDNGLIINEKCLLKNEPRKCGYEKSRNVIYDKSYVLAYIKNKLIDNLLYLTQNELIDLIKECYNHE